ncbi:MAG: hypothetical protein ACYTBZ_29105, partial [Planctomycetota bacterium]
MEIKIIDLTLENIDALYPGHDEGNELRRTWVRKMIPKGYQRKLAYDKQDELVGWVEYMPVPEALDCVDGENVNVIHCLIDTVDYSQGSAITHALLHATEQDSAQNGRGVAFPSRKFTQLLLER